MLKFTHTHTHAQIHTHTHTHAQIHTHTHTHTSSKGMRSFIPEEDRPSFEAFLIENGRPIDQSEQPAVTKPHPPAGEGRRGRRGRGQAGHVTDVDKFLADIDSHADAMIDTSNF